MTRSLSFLRSTFILSLVFIISACGGGGGGSNPDTTPDSFSFTAEAAVEPGEQVESASVTITGIDSAAAISISGGEYRVNGGSYTSGSGTVSNGQSVQVRLTASSEFSSDASLTLTIGGVSGTYTVTTLAQDITPASYEFAARSDVAPSSQQDTIATPISDLNDAAPISISNGEYAIDGGAFTSEDGLISNNQEVIVRVTASSLFSTGATATLSIGPAGATVDAAFTVTTLAQDITPTSYEFAARSDVALSSQQDTIATPISDLNDAAPISISNGEYAIDGGAFTSEDGLISNNQEVIVRVTASPLFSTAATATLSIGPEGATVDGTFTVTTLDRDDTPESFARSPILGSAISTLNSFPEIIVAGLNDQVDISITAGAFTINGGSPVTSGTVSNDDSVIVQLTSSASFDTTVNATLTIGSESSMFTVVTEAQDIAPASVTITAEDEAVAGALVISDDITVSDINDTISVSVTNGTFDVGGDNNFQSSGNVTNGQVLRVRASSSSDSLGVTTATLNLSEGAHQQSADFQIRTALTFESQTDIAPETENVQSDTVVTLSDFGESQAVSVTNGEVSINGGAFVTSGTASDGQTVEVRADASSDTNDDVIATVTIGDYSGTYTVTTLADETAPTADIVFPTPVTATEGLTLTVRGTAEDDYNDIQTITLTVTTAASGVIDTVTATSLNDGTFASWSGEVDLESGATNVISVTTEDSAGNIETSAASVSVNHQAVVASFPDANNRLEDISSGGISLDTRNNRLIVSDADAVYRVNIDTGVRTELISSATLPSAPNRVHIDNNTGNIFISALIGIFGDVYTTDEDGLGLATISESPSIIGDPFGLRVSPFDGRLYGSDNTSLIFAIDLETGAAEREAFFDVNFSLTEPNGFDFVDSQTLLIAESDEQYIYSVDITVDDGVFTVLLDSSDVDTPRDVEYDSDNNRAIFVDSGLDAVLSVPVTGGAMTTISNATSPNSVNQLFDPAGIVVKDEEDIAFVTSRNNALSLDDIIVVDLISGERVILSRSQEP
ncbi:MAG: hypothetical protein K6L80_04205 [Agarilytica sp.]